MRPIWKPIVTVVAAGLVLLSFVTLQTQRTFCDQRADTREDARSVWLYLVAREPERRDDPDVVSFIEFLNGRLPALECTWWGSYRPGEGI